MGALSIWHWLIVLAVVLLLFGSKKLPDAARGLGRSMRIFKSEIKEMQNDDKPAGTEEPQALTQAGQPTAAQFVQPQAHPQQQAQAYPQTQPQGYPQTQPAAYPQAPQQPYQQPQGQQPYQPQQPLTPQQPVQPPQNTDPTAPYHGGTGPQGQ
ncbi:Sec-independent protein translocase subunit TatA [Rhodococcus sp. IEGM 1408]|uniref:Sec-independent protein translocase subunit TatA n=1 Tax=Rhodococcus sp. IEGM 1408 TaxID=3082220 RepID=UPI002954166E|nr:Sec-independent protein translocase subunit TatA [Rhodococcus sp. IEGM 1408]MDV8000198.1 Sec-independent protein translocase subunit TatA [Rhodococcus sp. IEGM 1408]